MTSTPKTFGDNTSTFGSHHHHHLHHTGKRLRHFFRPDGRKVHIAGSPDEFETLQRTLSMIEKDNFDLVIHGTPEHVSAFDTFVNILKANAHQIEALKETHEHHKATHKKLKEQHGDLVDEFERVIRQLDELSLELHMISEHAVQLDASFSKYGYSAHLRKCFRITTVRNQEKSMSYIFAFSVACFQPFFVPRILQLHLFNSFSKPRNF